MQAQQAPHAHARHPAAQQAAAPHRRASLYIRGTARAQLNLCTRPLHPCPAPAHFFLPSLSWEMPCPALCASCLSVPAEHINFGNPLRAHPPSRSPACFSSLARVVWSSMRLGSCWMAVSSSSRPLVVCLQHAGVGKGPATSVSHWQAGKGTCTLLAACSGRVSRKKAVGRRPPTRYRPQAWPSRRAQNSRASMPNNSALH